MLTSIRLLVGLGNPGDPYAATRHNMGFIAVDRIAEEHGFPAWKAKFSGLLTEKANVCGNYRVLLLKPQTYMNNSGLCVAQVKAFYKLAPEDIIAFHDEMDLEPGRIKVKVGGGNAGHNGLKSIESAIGNSFARVRIGIGRPAGKSEVTPYVLGNFTRQEREIAETASGATSGFLRMLLEGDYATFLSKIAASAGGIKA